MCGASVQTVLQPGGQSLSQLREANSVNFNTGNNSMNQLGQGGGYQSVPINFGPGQGTGLGTDNSVVGHGQQAQSQGPPNPNRAVSLNNNLGTIEIVVKSPGGTGTRVSGGRNSAGRNSNSSPVQ